MAIPTNYVDVAELSGGTANNVGKGVREDLLDIITNVDPTDTPGVSMFGKTTANGLFHEWLTDGYEATSTAGTEEGATFAPGSSIIRKRMGNTCQIFRRDFAVTRTAETVARKGGLAGVTDEFSYQGGKRVLEVGRNIESRLWASATGTVGPATGTPRVMANVRGLLVDGVASVTNIGATADVFVQVTGAWGTAGFLSLQTTMFTNGINPNTLMVSPGVKRDISDTLMIVGAATAAAQAGAFRFTGDPSSGQWTDAVDIIRTDFGPVAIVADRWIPQASATAASATAGGGPAYFLFDRSKLRLAFLDPVQLKRLPSDGDAERGVVVGELTLELLHPSAMGVGLNVTH